MSDRQLVIDNDAFVLLAAAGQLDRCIQLLGFSVTQSRRLPALPHMLAKSLEGKSKAFQKFTPEHRRQAVAESERVEGVQLRPADDEISQLLAPAINFDAPLYATIAESSTMWLHSADVSAMKKVWGAEEYAAVANAMRGRVVSLEALAYRFIESDGLPATTVAFGPVMYANKTLASIFGTGGAHTDPLDGARSYLRNLCSTLGRGFLHCPPCPDFHTAGFCRIEQNP